MINSKKDILLYCIDCNEEFTFTAGEQEYFESKQLSEPKRCLRCRKYRRLLIVPDKAARND